MFLHRQRQIGACKTFGSDDASVQSKLPSYVMQLSRLGVGACGVAETETTRQWMSYCYEGMAADMVRASRGSTTAIWGGPVSQLEVVQLPNRLVCCQ